jgi:hypothetical protein
VNRVIPSILLYSASVVVGLAALGALPLSIGYCGALLTLVALAWPTSPSVAGVEGMRLDEYLPQWQFSERHATIVHAPEERVWRAIREVTAGEIRFFLLLTWLRSPHLPGRGDQSILHAHPGRPILDTAIHTGFVELGEDQGREVLVGAVLEHGRFRKGLVSAAFRDLAEPGLVKTAMNFRVTAQQPGCVRLSTETRVATTDARSLRLFGVYWRLILPGSALIRRNWLAAIRRRAERPA